MAQPKKKTSHQKQGQRRSHWKIELPSLSNCPKCHAPKLPHEVCRACGIYNGKQIIQTVAAAE
ncbi:MAG TPA: 50S ribosomal protein L32 [Cyanobacteria bacterium UBA8530]|nr:50S ribosomal protein L32 [Cyanobacteria bacterium UBA8530]